MHPSTRRLSAPKGCQSVRSRYYNALHGHGQTQTRSAAGDVDLETHRAVFTWVLQCLSAAGLVKGNTIGIDATTLEANAALRSIARRDTAEGYEEFLTKLAKGSGIGTPTCADLARIDRKRKKKGSNDEGRIRTIPTPRSPR